jgi:threonine synthase
MKFVSVNGTSPPADFSTALLQGLAPDGGLYVPEKIPHLPQPFIDHLDQYSLHEIGSEVVAQFLPEFSRDEIAGIIRASLTFSLPLVQLEDHLYLLELFHGPTLAFKDVGARFMAGMVSSVLSQQRRDVTVLVATSGDTGSAVAQGFYGVPHVTVVVLYPSGRISRLQEQQMTTLGGNIRAIEIDGTFDDCQQLVKRALVDPEILSQRALTTANSINVARLLPQVVYYVWAYAQWKKFGNQHKAQPVVVVPSGNFGNLTAAVYAKWMGVPFGKFVAATNANDVVPQYFRSGVYMPQPSIQTLSNAMDVGNPSNISRLQLLYGNDIDKLRNDIEAVSCSDEDTMDQIASTYRKSRYILDPHTAVGVAAARRKMSTEDNDADYIVAATAHPAKFPETIHRAIGVDVPLPDSLQHMLSLQKKSSKLGKEYNLFRHMLLS